MRLYAGTTQGVFKVNPDSGIVTRLGPHETSVEALAVHGDTIIAAVTPDYGLPMREPLSPRPRPGAMRSVDGGRRWLPCGGLLEHASVTALAYGAGGFVAGTDPAQILHSYDLGATWTMGAALADLPGADRWAYPLPPHTAHVMRIVAHPTRTTMIYAGIEVGGLVISGDSGCNWQVIGARTRAEAVHPDIHDIAFCVANPHVMYVATPDGVAQSVDAGATWVERIAGLDPLYCRAVAVHPEDPAIVVAVVTETASGFFGADADRTGARVFRSDDMGETWHHSSVGLPDVFQPTPGLVADVTVPGRFFLPLFSGEVFVSIDAGYSWQLLAEGIPTILRLVSA